MVEDALVNRPLHQQGGHQFSSLLRAKALHLDPDAEAIPGHGIEGAPNGSVPIDSVDVQSAHQQPGPRRCQLGQMLDEVEAEAVAVAKLADH